MQTQCAAKKFAPRSAVWCGKQLETIASQRLVNQQHIRQWVGVDSTNAVGNCGHLTHAQAAKRRLQALEVFFDNLKMN